MKIKKIDYLDKSFINLQNLNHKIWDKYDVSPKIEIKTTKIICTKKRF
jgi:hypothetical protein